MSSAIAADFMKFATNAENQDGMVEALKRLPGNAEAFDRMSSPATHSWLRRLTPRQRAAQPVQLEMRCVFDAMNTGIRDMFAGSNDFAARRQRCSRPQTPASASCNRVAAAPAPRAGAATNQVGEEETSSLDAFITATVQVGLTLVAVAIVIALLEGFLYLVLVRLLKWRYAVPSCSWRPPWSGWPS